MTDKSFTRSFDKLSKTQIKQLLQQMANSWNIRDLRSFMTGYWNSPEVTFSSGGQVTKGWQNTLRRYEKRYQSADADMGKLSFHAVTVNILNSDAAFVHGQWKLIGNKTCKGLFTLVMRRFSNSWRIVHDHSST